MISNKHTYSHSNVITNECSVKILPKINTFERLAIRVFYDLCKFDDFLQK